MENNAVITIDGVQTIGTESTDTHLMCEGVYTYDEDRTKIVYKQIDPEDNISYKTIITVTKDKVVMIKDGAFNLRMEFCVGSRYVGSYETPYGVINMGINASLVEHTLNEKGGVIKLKYLLEMGEIAETLNETEVKISLM